MNIRDGILLIDKPAGVTSFDVVNHVRMALVRSFPELAPPRKRIVKGGPKPPKFKCGHAGTLDPLATGLLVLLVGKGSRLSPFLMGQDKTYAATVRFGATTDTHDREGETISTAPPPDSIDTVAAQLDAFRGDIMQIPPIISALKKDGQPLYKLARSGQDVPEPDARPVTINRLEMTGARWGEPAAETVFEIDLEVTCSSGTYIRSLARDLARASASEGYIQELRRLSVGPFEVTDALAGAMEMDGTQLAFAMRPLGDALPQVPALTVNAEEAAAVRQGQQPHPAWLARLGEEPVPVGKSGRLFRILDTANDLVAIGRLDDESDEPVLAVVIPGETLG
jgi:tRNA pseudouridine55 synthase